MPFKKGDYVKTKGDKPEYGTVIADEAGGQVTFRTAWRENKTVAATSLEKNEGAGAFLTAEAPDLMEVAANVIVFGVQEKAMGKAIMSAEAMRFAVEDIIYEFALKGYAQKYVPLTVEPLTGEDMKSFFNTQDVYDAANKALVIEAIDIAYALVSKRKPFTSASMWYFLKCVTAMSIANVGQRYMQKKGTSYSHQ